MSEQAAISIFQKVNDHSPSNTFLAESEKTEKDSLTEKECFVCKICYKRFSSLGYLRVHYAEHFQQQPSACEVCGETFTEAQDFAEHCVLHAEYICFICMQSFSDKIQFVLHQEKHQLNCEICKLTFHSENELEMHRRSHDPKYFQCKICLKYYSTKLGLKRHLVVHTGDQPYKCKICFQSFSHSSSLSTHSMIHKNIKRHNCKLCGKSFSMKISLTTHLLKHEGKEPYVCVICDRRFADQRQFKRHGMKHIPSEKSTCGICGKIFTNPSSLKLHFKLHTNEGNFKCDICGRTFNYSGNLKRHEMWHSGERPFECNICNIGYISRFRLINHLKQKHTNLTEEEHFKIIKQVDALNNVKNST
ncbi:zinc finger protein 227 [Nephila pilipes]|uniref:Zinc finger protein 227 n=1 Tax=Nephila pilipes TaxID=299642 RepID=A0A8X6N2M1_NEPPI|nr:zinc finger protein 227 [Nephila pilipes]